MAVQPAVKFACEATGIGSVPFTDPVRACATILEAFDRIPFWPQLPRRSFYENMYVQYAEGLPGIVIDEPKKQIYVDTEKVLDRLEEVYAKCLANDVDYFAISPDYAKGFYAFLDVLKSLDREILYAKGNLTGPISFGLFLTDREKKSVIYDKDFFEILTRVLIMKVKWQIRLMKRYFPRVIIFIDEPYLISIGSSFVTINAAEVFPRLDDVIAAIQEEGALAGIHCCGNTDWSLLLKRKLDILSFDAYGGAKEFSLYHEEIAAFTKRGGSIAWGIVPSSDQIEKESPVSLAARLNDAMALLAAKGIGRETISSLVTPSCGVGTLDESTAAKIITTTAALSRTLRVV